MRRSIILFASLFISSFPALAVDGVPILNVKPTCEGGQVAAVSGGRQYLENCLPNEEVARDLKTSWSQVATACAPSARNPAIGFELLELEELHRSSDTIGAIAGALAKAQAELINPEKSLANATDGPPG